MGVMVTHVAFQSGHSLQGRFAGFTARLDLGVALFFVISGFLLFRPHVLAHVEGRTRPATRRYLWYRAVRILPVLWVAVAAAWLLLGEARPGLYLAHALLVQIYIPDHYVHGLTQMWSLATEVAFYIALPALGALLCRGPSNAAWVRRMVVLLGAAALLGPAWMYASTALGYSLPRLWLPGFIGWFGAGMLLAVWSVATERGVVTSDRLSALSRYPGTLWLLALALFALATTPIAGPLDLSDPTPSEAALKNGLYCVIAVLVVLPCIPRHTDPPRGLGMISGQAGRVLGDISYGIFAYHVVILGLVDQALGLTLYDGRFWVRLVVTLTVSVAVATLSFVLMERPLMRWARSQRLGRAVVSSPRLRTRQESRAQRH